MPSLRAQSSLIRGTRASQAPAPVNTMDPSMITPEMMAQAQKMMANMTPDQMVRARPPHTDRGISAHSPCIPFLPADFFHARVAGVADRHDPRV